MNYLLGGVLLIISAMLSFAVGNIDDLKSNSIKYGCAQYNQTTGVFEWIKKGESK